MPKLSVNPQKGMSDWLPDEMRIRQHIFAVWRQTCLSYGYQEYLTPLLEPAEIYRAKSGEVGGPELLTLTDRAGRELAVRPEMTPSVTRLVSKIYDSEQKPIRFFSIANFLRNEKPQRGRNREFWQLNYDIFGSSSLTAEIEVAQLALDIMLQFNPPADSFKLYLNNRKLLDNVLETVGVAEANKTAVLRLLDKWEKLSVDQFQQALRQLKVSNEQEISLIDFMNYKSLDDLVKNLPELADSLGLQETRKVLYTLDQLGYGEWLAWRPSIIRGFDYYDGLVFEVYDNNPKNSRSLFGGGRYNSLAGIFSKSAFPAVGCAPGDETIRLFLEGWGLLERVSASQKADTYYLPLLSAELAVEMQALARNLRGEGKRVEIGLETQQISKALSCANKKKITWVVIFGSEEKKRRIYKIKDMNTGKETSYKL